MDAAGGQDLCVIGPQRATDLLLVRQKVAAHKLQVT